MIKMNILRFSPKNKEEKLERYRRMYKLAGNSQFVKKMIEKKVKTIGAIKKEPLPF